MNPLNSPGYGPAIGCEIVHFCESLAGGEIYGNFSAMGHIGT